MNSIQGLVLRVAALVVGSAIVGASIASNPATAQDFSSMLKAFSITTCSTSGACKQYKNTGSGAGVKGVASSGNGVIAVSTNGSATLSTSTNGNGIQAYSTNFDATNSGTDNNSTTHPGRSGVYGHDDSTDGGTKNVGVFGLSTNGTGVEGVSGNGFGAFGFSTNNAGLQGTSTNGHGVNGFSTNREAGYFESGAASNYALVALSDSSGGFPFLAEGSGGAVTVDPLGNVASTGAMYATSFNIISDEIANDGKRVASYASQSADAEMSDVGTGRIVDGRGIVQLDSTFARTLDVRSGYHVFLTPMGDCKGLYIASKSPGSFEVREMQGGQSTLSFDFRIIGRAAGVKSGRLPTVRLPAPEIQRRPASAHALTH